MADIKENDIDDFVASMTSKQSVELKAERKECNKFVGELKGNDVYYIFHQDPHISLKVYITNNYSEFKARVSEFYEKFAKENVMYEQEFAYCISNKDQRAYSCSNLFTRKPDEDFEWINDQDFNWLSYIGSIKKK